MAAPQLHLELQPGLPPDPGAIPLPVQTWEGEDEGRRTFPLGLRRWERNFAPPAPTAEARRWERELSP